MKPFSPPSPSAFDCQCGQLPCPASRRTRAFIKPRDELLREKFALSRLLDRPKNWCSARDITRRFLCLKSEFRTLTSNDNRRLQSIRLDAIRRLSTILSISCLFIHHFSGDRLARAPYGIAIRAGRRHCRLQRDAGSRITAATGASPKNISSAAFPTAYTETKRRSPIVCLYTRFEEDHCYSPIQRLFEKLRNRLLRNVIGYCAPLTPLVPHCR